MESAAALAASHLLFKAHVGEGGGEDAFDRIPDYDETYVASLLQHAEELFDFAVRCPGHYVEDGKVGREGGREGGRELI